jgi:ankyrin repeat protein
MCSSLQDTYRYHPYLYFGASVLQLGMTPLHCAVKNGNVEVTALLLERGANIKAKDKVCD